MSLRMRLSAMTALAFLLTVILATVTVGGTQTLLEVPQEPWAPICLAWLGVLSCAVLTLAGAWHVASGLLALAATRDEDVVSSRLGQALLRAVARRGAPAVRRTVAGTLLLGLATASPAAAQVSAPSDDLGWSPTSSETGAPPPERPAAPEPGTQEDEGPDAPADASAQPGQSAPSQPGQTPSDTGSDTASTGSSDSPGADVPLRPAQPRPSELVPPSGPPAADAAAATTAGGPEPHAGRVQAPGLLGAQAAQGAGQAPGRRPHPPRPQSRARSPHPSATNESVPTAGSGETVTVAPGDSLWQITRSLLEAARDGEVSDAEVLTSWPELYAVNVAAIGPDPSLIHPGTVLTVPDSLRR